MAHNRLKDDLDEYRQALLEGTGPSRYVMNTPMRVRDKGVAVTADPRVSTQGLPVALCGMPLVEIDSELLGITRRYAKCDAAKFDPRRDSLQCNTRPLPDIGVSSELDTEDCRLSNPPCTLRGTGINRFEWLCRDPQDTALVPFGIPSEDRRIAKDNHRPLIDNPIRDQALPPEPAAGFAPSAAGVEVGLDIEKAIAAYPPLLTMQHWRDAGEVRRIYGCQRNG
jgi:hypothetical protein